MDRERDRSREDAAGDRGDGMRTRAPRDSGTRDGDREREIAATREKHHQPVSRRAPFQAFCAWLPTH